MTQQTEQSPSGTITLMEFLSCMAETMHDNNLIVENGEFLEPDPSVENLPVEVLFQAENGEPVAFPILGFGIKANAQGQILGLVISTTEHGAFSDAAKN